MMAAQAMAKEAQIDNDAVFVHMLVREKGFPTPPHVITSLEIGSGDSQPILVLVHQG